MRNVSSSVPALLTFVNTALCVYYMGQDKKLIYDFSGLPLFSDAYIGKKEVFFVRFKFFLSVSQGSLWLVLSCWLADFCGQSGKAHALDCGLEMVCTPYFITSERENELKFTKKTTQLY